MSSPSSEEPPAQNLLPVGLPKNLRRTWRDTAGQGHMAADRRPVFGLRTAALNESGHKREFSAVLKVAFYEPAWPARSRRALYPLEALGIRRFDFRQFGLDVR